MLHQLMYLWLVAEVEALYQMEMQVAVGAVEDVLQHL
jgi:hypothetical protein